MPDISATDAARGFADLLDAIEHRGEHFTITRRGKPVAHLEPAGAARGAEVKRVLRELRADDGWRADLASVRAQVVPQDRA